MSCSRHLTAFSWGPVGKGAAGQVSNAGHALHVLGDSHTSVPISWEACKVMAVLPFPGESVQAFIQLPRGPWLTGVQNCSADPWAATVASLPSLGGSLIGLRHRQGEGNSVRSRTPRCSLDQRFPSSCPWAQAKGSLSLVQPGHTPQAPGAGSRPRPRSHPPSTPASVPPHIWPRAHRSCCLRAIC